MVWVGAGSTFQIHSRLKRGISRFPEEGWVLYQGGMVLIAQVFVFLPNVLGMVGRSAALLRVPCATKEGRLDGLSSDVCGAPPPLPCPVILESGLPAAGPGFPRAPALPLPTLPVTHILRPHCFCSRRPPPSHRSLWGGANWGLEREREEREQLVQR